MRALNNELVRRTRDLGSGAGEEEQCSLENYATERTIVTLAPHTTTTTTTTTRGDNCQGKYGLWMWQMSLLIVWKLILAFSILAASNEDDDSYEDKDGSGSDEDYDEEEEATGPCSANPNGPNPDPEECSQFYLCAGGVPHLMTCRCVLLNT